MPEVFRKEKNPRFITNQKRAKIGRTDIFIRREVAMTLMIACQSRVSLRID